MADFGPQNQKFLAAANGLENFCRLASSTAFSVCSWARPKKIDMLAAREDFQHLNTENEKIGKLMMAQLVLERWPPAPKVTDPKLNRKK